MILLALFSLCLTNVSQATLVPPGAMGRPVDRVPKAFADFVLSWFYLLYAKILIFWGAGLEQLLDMQN